MRKLFKLIHLINKRLILLLLSAAVAFAACDEGNNNEMVKNSVVDLKDITLSAGSLNSKFSSSTTVYSASIPNSENSVTVTGIPLDENATVTSVTLNNIIVGIQQAAIITVTAYDKTTTKIYTVNIDRAGDYVSSNIGTLKYVPSGSFQRDSDSSNISILTYSYRMCQTEITRAQYVAVMEISDPSNVNRSTGTTDPVQMVTWYDAVEFCNKLSLKESLTPVYTITNRVPETGYPITSAIVTVTDWAANGYRLPTEMEWMWAAIGATSDVRTGDIVDSMNIGGYTKSYSGSTEVDNNYLYVGQYAWYSGNSYEKTHPVADVSKNHNELEIYDMSGNVWEWCWDLYNDDFLSGTLTDYRGPDSGYAHVVRGGSWGDNGPGVRVGFHSWGNSSQQYNGGGFRVVRN